MHGYYATDGSYLKDCTFIGNEADKSGGALYSVYNVSTSAFKDNNPKAVTKTKIDKASVDSIFFASFI